MFLQSVLHIYSPFFSCFSPAVFGITELFVLLFIGITELFVVLFFGIAELYHSNIKCALPCAI